MGYLPVLWVFVGCLAWNEVDCETLWRGGANPASSSSQDTSLRHALSILPCKPLCVLAIPKTLPQPKANGNTFSIELPKVHSHLETTCKLRTI